MATTPTGQLDFERDIKPLFRPRDHGAMASSFDLWSAADVRRHAPQILEKLRAGSMPCDGPWPQDRIDLLQRWVDQGTDA